MQFFLKVLNGRGDAARVRAGSIDSVAARPGGGSAWDVVIMAGGEAFFAREGQFGSQDEADAFADRLASRISALYKISDAGEIYDISLPKAPKPQ